jgi:hypothetical protein
VILTVVDRFSKYAHFIALSHPYTATSVARIFFAEIVCFHGIPASIVSDRDPVFTSHLCKDLFKPTGSKLRLSTAFHPKHMVNQKSPIAQLLCTCDASQEIDLVPGWTGFHGRNIAMIHPSTQCCRLHHSNWYTDVSLRHWYHTNRARRNPKPWKTCYKTETISWQRCGTVFFKHSSMPSVGMTTIIGK